MKVASLQLSPGRRTPAERIALAEKKLLSLRGVDLAILPELWSVGGFTFSHYMKDASAVALSVQSMIISAARKLRCHILSGSMLERTPQGVFNTNYLMSPSGEILACYRKIHLFGYQSIERKLLKGGEEIVTVKTPLAHFGLATCYDLRFPELFRKLTEKGAEIFLISSAWPTPRKEAWNVLQRARAMENQVFVLSCNAGGTDGKTRFAGNSALIEPYGGVLAKLGSAEGILRAELDIKKVKEARKNFPALADRVLFL